MPLDKITLKNAVEVPVWAVVAATEPNRAIEVQMTYADLLAIVNWITSTVGGKENKDGKN